MTLAELRETCKGQFALPSTEDDPFLTDVQWTAALNRAYRWLAFRAPLLSGTFLVTTVAGTREYPLFDEDSEVAVVDFVEFKQQGISWSRLGEVPYTRISQLSTFHDQQGCPSCYYVRGRNVGFYPMPDTTNEGAYVEVWGSLYPVLLSADDDEPDISAYQQDYLIDPTLYEMAKQVFNRSAGKMSPSQLQFYQARRDEALVEIRMTLEGRTSEAKFMNTAYDTDAYAGGGH